MYEFRLQSHPLQQMEIGNAADSGFRGIVVDSLCKLRLDSAYHEKKGCIMSKCQTWMLGRQPLTSSACIQ